MSRTARRSAHDAGEPDLRAIARRRSAIAGVLALLLGAALVFDLPSRLTPEMSPSPGDAPVAEPVALTPAAPTNPANTAGLRLGSSGCLEPGQWSIHRDAGLERGESSSAGWNPSPAHGHLASDPCGALWALWFNSWTVLSPGDPDRVASVQLARSGETQRLAREGVASFAFDARRALWALGREGGVARHDGSGWAQLPALEGCRDGQLLRWRQEMWAACPSSARGDADGRAQPAATSVLRWNDTGRRWDGIGGAPAGARRLAVDARERLWTAGENSLARRDAGRGEGWHVIRSEHGQPTALIATPDGLAVGSEQGLWLFDAEGTPVSAELDGVHVVGLAVENARLWVATWRNGLYLREGGQWHHWRYVQGLPDDRVRDVLADPRGRIWLGSSPGGWMLAAAAAAQIKRLSDPVALPAPHYATACDAAAERLADVKVSGAVARVDFEGRTLVFIDGRQACPQPAAEPAPTPVFVRRVDGTLLELAYNGHGGSRFAQGPEMAAYWRVRVHHPMDGGGWHSLDVPPPDPLPPETPGALAQLDARDQIWIATSQSGIWQFDGQRWWRHGEEAGYHGNNRPQSMLADSEGLLWVGSSPTWLFEEKRHAGPALQRWQDGRWLPAELDERGLSVFALASGAGLRWIGDNGKLWRLGPEGMVALDDEALRQRGLITRIAIDAQGHAWLTHGSSAEGLSYRDGERTRIVTSREGLFTDAIAHLAFDADQRLWLQAESGEVAVYDRATLIDASH